MQGVVDFPQLSSLPEQIQRLSDTVEELLKEIKGAAAAPAPVDEFLTPAQAAERYHVTTLTLRNLEKRDILNLLDHSLRADGVQIFIGQESGFKILDDCSVITAPYSADNEVVGVIGVIGPTRMAYERVIPIVDVTAKILGAALARR